MPRIGGALLRFTPPTFPAPVRTRNRRLAASLTTTNRRRGASGCTLEAAIHPHRPLSDARQQNRLDELRMLFTNVRVDQPEAEVVLGRSWMCNLSAYRRLFPPAYVETAVRTEPELQFMSLWGQFLDRPGNLRPEPTQVFLERMATATTLYELTASFPLSVLAPRCGIQPFFTFYGV